MRHRHQIETEPLMSADIRPVQQLNRHIAVVAAPKSAASIFQDSETDSSFSLVERSQHYRNVVA